jgi:7-carboxy-7-deazaguanine synthase
MIERGASRKVSLRVCELFCSIQGETAFSGFPSFFIRLAGCNLNCAWCDTPYARAAGTPMTADKILKAVIKHRFIHHVTLTGGEPLLQEHAPALMDMLLEKGFAVQLETNGSLGLQEVPSAVRKIADVKTPSSGEEGSFHMKNLGLLGPRDELKFVIADKEDYIYSRRFVRKFLEKSGVTVNFSPILELLPPARLAELILRDRLSVRLNVQIHKLIWPAGEPTGL